MAMLTAQPVERGHDVLDPIRTNDCHRIPEQPCRATGSRVVEKDERTHARLEAERGRLGKQILPLQGRISGPQYVPVTP
ncbi:hypothetical protein SCH01S_46_00150 [Sphingomonas changbaiensis NBRC 104936]|uniref:Uncharacterized protein n=1 Tax=Sphingomonas changbaiensis NBRC 104936 TaxID=1219043 RepID=A0A0E9MS35_9SPHN|nr:hypothetical protein SCH01S_46_00150 [Sphingomonas changbaiensis NBRC 104936]